MPSNGETVVRRLVDEVYNRGDFDGFDELFTVDTVDHTPLPGQPPVLQAPGVDGVLATLKLWRSAFADLHVTVHETTTDGDLVWWRWTATGTHVGELAGVAPTGEAVEMHGIELVRLRDGKIAERWGYGNFAELMLHLQVGRGGPLDPGQPSEELGALPTEQAGGGV